ncbi:MAG: hypothetical protein NC548_59860, partial [Lachnospiraceae bacterium]|nr:hypothetical protein [Lachnospiraceae bacterium]
MKEALPASFLYMKRNFLKMWFFNITQHEVKFLREATEKEVKLFSRTAVALQEYQANIARFTRVDTNYKILEIILSSSVNK